MPLEEKINDKESKGFIRKTMNLGFNAAAAAATTALSVSLVGTTGAITGTGLGIGYLIGNLLKGKPFHESLNAGLKAYSAFNAIIAPSIWISNVTYPLIPIDTFKGIITRSAYALTAYNATFVASYNAAYHLIDNKLNPSGIINGTFGNFYNDWRRIGSVYAPGYIMSALGISPLGLSPFSFNAPFAGIYNSIKPIPKKEPLPSYRHAYASAA